MAFWWCHGIPKAVEQTTYVPDNTSEKSNAQEFLLVDDGGNTFKVASVGICLLDHSYHRRQHGQLESTLWSGLSRSGSRLKYPRNSSSLSSSDSLSVSNQQQATNKAAVSYIHRQEGTHSTALLWGMENIMLWAERKLSDLRTVYLPGHLNTEADCLSQKFQDGNERSLHPRIFN